MFQCKICHTRMIKSNYEYYCPRCGLVETNYIKFNNYREGVGIPVPPWKSNFSQTKKPFVWRGGRRIIRRCV